MNAGAVKNSEDYLLLFHQQYENWTSKERLSFLLSLVRAIGREVLPSRGHPIQGAAIAQSLDFLEYSKAIDDGKTPRVFIFLEHSITVLKGLTFEDVIKVYNKIPINIVG